MRRCREMQITMRRHHFRPTAQLQPKSQKSFGECGEKGKLLLLVGIQNITSQHSGGECWEYRCSRPGQHWDPASTSHHRPPRPVWYVRLHCLFFLFQPSPHTFCHVVPGSNPGPVHARQMLLLELRDPDSRQKTQTNQKAYTHTTQW